MERELEASEHEPFRELGNFLAFPFFTISRARRFLHDPRNKRSEAAAL